MPLGTGESGHGGGSDPCGNSIDSFKKGDQAYHLFGKSLSRVPWIWDDVGLCDARSCLFLICRPFHGTSLFCSFPDHFVPQLFGYDPFTYAIAKQMTPERVWNTPLFRTINLHLTYFWSILFFVNFLSSGLGHGKPLFSILIPLILVLAVGLPVVKIYPKYYLKRRFSSPAVDPSLLPVTAKELISRMPMGFRPEAAGDLKAEIQFDLFGEGGVKGVLSISQGKCSFREGDASSPALKIHGPADVWMKIARQEINRAQALMDGLYEVKGDMNLLMKMGDLFRPPARQSRRKN